MTPPEQIAAGLSGARRNALITSEPGVSRPFGEVHGPTRCWLFRAGLLAYEPGSDYRFVLTPLGEQVRAHLLGEKP